MTLKEFLLLDENKKSYWQAINWLMGLAISFIAYQAGTGLQWALITLPIAKILSEMITRYFNDAYDIKFGKNNN